MSVCSSHSSTNSGLDTEVGVATVASNSLMPVGVLSEVGLSHTHRFNTHMHHILMTTKKQQAQNHSA